MRKLDKTRSVKLNLETRLQRSLKYLQKNAISFWKNARPYLAAKYWPLYLIAFCAGIYLWGPSHGLQSFQDWLNRPNQKKAETPDVETLQRQLNHLKQELETAQSNKKNPPFDPVTFSRPALGQVVRGFEWVESGNSWRLHTGVDIGLMPESNIIAAAAGTVSTVKELKPGDYTVTISHGDGWKSIYSNLAKVMVFEGQSVIKGVIIGNSGNNGCDPSVPGFHFAIYHDQQAVDPQQIIPGMLLNQASPE